MPDARLSRARDAYARKTPDPSACAHVRVSYDEIEQTTVCLDCGTVMPTKS